MNIKLFLFSNLIFISKINCIDLNKIEVFLDDKKVNTKDYIKIDEGEISLIKSKKVSISSIECHRPGLTLKNNNIGNLKKEDLKSSTKIIFYLKSHDKCCENLYIKFDDKTINFKKMPYNIIASFYKNLNKDINKKEANVDIFDSFDYAYGNLYTYISNYYSHYNGYEYGKIPSKNIKFLFVNDILIKKEVDSDFKSIIEKNDNNDTIIEKLQKLEKCKITFKMECIKNYTDKNIDIHINFDGFTDKDEYKVIGSCLKTLIDSTCKYYFNEFYKKKAIKHNGEEINDYQKLYKHLPYDLKFNKEKNKYKKKDLIEKIKEYLKNYAVKIFNYDNFCIDYFFPDDNIKIYKKEEYLNNNEQKVEIENDKDIYWDEVFVEFKAEDIIRFYSIIPVINTKSITCNVKFETSNGKLKDKILEFEYHDLLSDYLKENIFCQNGFEFVKNINNYKVIYQNTEYNPGQHIDIDPNISTDIIFKILEKDEDIDKKINDQEAKKQALIKKIKDDLDALKSNITNEMTSNNLRDKLNTIINGEKIEDQECKNLINEINAKIKEKVQKELESTKDVLQKHKLVNDALKDLLNNIKEKTVIDLQTSLNNILPNGYNPDEENKKLIDQVKSEINAKKNSKKNDQQNTTDNTDQEVNIVQTKRTSCSSKCKSNK